MRSLPFALAAAAVAFLLLSPGAHAKGEAVVWTSPTGADQARFMLKAGSSLTLTLAASSSKSTAEVDIRPLRGMPTGSTITTNTDGGKARATFRWRPLELGVYTLQFVASSGPRASAPVRTYVIRVTPNVKYPYSYGLANAKFAHWAVVTRPVPVRLQPKQSAKVVAKLATMTPEDTQNLVLVLQGRDVRLDETWYRVRLPVLPNNTTGWVPATALGDLTKVRTHLFLDRSKLTITLHRNGVKVFTARIGIGKSHWPTPRGQYYIRTRLTNFGSPVYGPIAFGTSARSAVLTDWPGGGFIGIHGTNEPGILPGQVSHGCIRLRNEDILRLAKLMRVGTPLTIR